jgi:hypothetical protein
LDVSDLGARAKLASSSLQSILSGTAAASGAVAASDTETVSVVMVVAASGCLSNGG